MFSFLFLLLVLLPITCGGFRCARRACACASFGFEIFFVFREVFLGFICDVEVRGVFGDRCRRIFILRKGRLTAVQFGLEGRWHGVQQEKERDGWIVGTLPQLTGRITKG